MHHNCNVSRCDNLTQDVICGSCVDTLVKAIQSIVSNPNPEAPTTRIVPLKEGLVEISVQHDGLWADLDVTLTRQSRMAKAERTGTPDGSPNLFVEAASDARRKLEATVWYWVYLFADTNQHLTFDPYTASVPEACAWIVQFPGLIASLDGAGDMCNDFTRVTATAARLVDRRADRSLLGVCGAVTTAGKCEAPLWLYEGDTDVLCRECGAGFSAEERQGELVQHVRAQVGTPTEIAAQLAHFVGLTISVNTIRTWARTKADRLPVVERTDDDRPKYRVEDVFVLAQERKIGTWEAA